jgi:hypothetical protein
LTLSRTMEPRLAAAGVAVPTRQAAIALASTLGVVVPPSLVLILLGDAMLTAHTIASNAMHRTDRIINTQDVMRGALAAGRHPAGAVLAGGLGDGQPGGATYGRCHPDGAAVGCRTCPVRP